MFGMSPLELAIVLTVAALFYVGFRGPPWLAMVPTKPTRTPIEPPDQSKPGSVIDDQAA